MSMSSTLDAPTDTDRIGSFNYLIASVQNSLYRNGRVFTRRDADGSDANWEGVDLEPRDMAVHFINERREQAIEERNTALARAHRVWLITGGEGPGVDRERRDVSDALLSGFAAERGSEVHGQNIHAIRYRRR